MHMRTVPLGALRSTVCAWLGVETRWPLMEYNCTPPATPGMARMTESCALSCLKNTALCSGAGASIMPMSVFLDGLKKVTAHIRGCVVELRVDLAGGGGAAGGSSSSEAAVRPGCSSSLPG